MGIGRFEGEFARGRAAGPAARSAAETGGARLPAGTAGGLRPVCLRLLQSGGGDEGKGRGG